MTLSRRRRPTFIFATPLKRLVLLCRLNYRLSIACHDTIMNKCADACTSTSIDQPCGGTVLRCLTEQLDEITDAECKKEVFYFIKMEVTSQTYRHHHPLCAMLPCP